MMASKCITTFLFLVVLSIAGAQTIYTNTNGVHAKAVGSVSSACMANGLVILTDSTGTDCLLISDALGNITSRSCPSAISGANAIYCIATICFATNPVSATIVAMNTSGTIIGSFGNGILSSPLYLTAFQSAAATYTILVVDYNGTYSNIWNFAWTPASYTSSLVLALPGSLAGIFLSTNTSFVTGSLHGHSLDQYNISGAYFQSFGTSYGSVESLSIDYYGNAFVYDSSCACFAIVDSANRTIRTQSQALTPISVSHSRDAHFIVDSNGITQLFKTMTIAVTATNSTCLTTGGSANIIVTGGASPYTYGSLPFVLKTTATTKTNVTLTGLAPSLNITQNYTIYAESVNMAFTESFGTGVKNSQTPAGNGVSPHSGNYSYSIYLIAGSHYQLKLSAVQDSPISGVYFSKLQVWVNPGLGGQGFNIDFGSSFTYYYYPGDLPLNTWTQLTFDFVNGAAAQYLYISFSGLSTMNTNASLVNPFYIDDMVLIPYNNLYPNRKFYVIDYCSHITYSPRITMTNDNVLTASVLVTPTTCNPASGDDDKGHDGIVSVVAGGGTGSYGYPNHFSNTTNPYVSGLSTFNSNILVYTNQVNVFSDLSTSAGRNPQDSTYYRSAPYSYSFTPSLNLDNLFFNYPLNLNASLYSAVEFYVNGGPTGGQTLSVAISRGNVQAGPILTLQRLIGIPTLPPNQWLKVVYPVTITGNFSGIYIYGIGNYLQNRAYIDDITLISNDYVVTVTDSANCVVTNAYINVTSPDVIVNAASTTNVKCFAGSDGTSTANVSGGTGPYFFSWSNTPIDAAHVTGLPQSTFTVNITDSHGCSSPIIQSYIAQPLPLVVNVEVTPIQCSGHDAMFNATAYGGTGPYTFEWTTTANSSSYQIVLQPDAYGIYTETFENSFASNGNPNVTSVCAGLAAPLSDSPNFTPAHAGYCSLLATPQTLAGVVYMIGCVTCIDTKQYNEVQLFMALEQASDFEHLSISLLQGSISVTTPLVLTNYSTNYTQFTWIQINYAFGGDIGLVDSVFIRSSIPTQGMILLDDVVLLPRSTASSIVTGKNVHSGFESVLTGIASSYSLTVTDANSCQTTKTFTLTEPLPLIVTTFITDKGVATTNVTGGLAPYSYFWVELNQTTASVKGLKSGEYTVMVTDSYGCSVNKTVISVIAPASKSQTPVLAGAITGAGVLILGIAGIIFYRVHKKQKLNVATLLQAEEGERRAYKIDFSALTLGTSIGAGSFGEVFIGEYKGTEVAVKRLKSQQMTKQQINEFAKEAAVMVGLRNPSIHKNKMDSEFRLTFVYILLFMGVCLDPDKLCIVTEFMPRGDLGEVLRNKDISLPLQIVFKMAQDTLKGLQFIHSSGFVHRDLKSPNLLVDRSWNIKIADFGLSCARREADEEAQISLLWTAPEIINREPDCYTFASDMYSIGIILWELMSKQLPWEGVAPAAITTKIVSGQRPPIGPDWDSSVTKLINACWAQDRNARPTVQAARSTLETEILSNNTNGEYDSSVYGSSLHNRSSEHRSVNVLLAPPPAPPLALVVCRIANAPQLWEKDPRGMAASIEDTTKLLRRKCAKLNGYEVDSKNTFMYAFSNPINAINFCLDTQTALLGHAWPESLLALDLAKEEKSDFDGTILHRGLRVRMGIHWCAPTLVRDKKTGHYQYAGPSLEVGQALPQHGCPGSVMLDQEMYNRTMGTASLELDPFIISPTGPLLCAGQDLHLFKMVPLAQKELLSEIGDTTNDEDDFEPWMVNLADLQFGEVIGTGSFGDVFAATLDNRRVAVKKFTRTKVSGEVHLEMRTECAILRSMHHRNILKFEGMILQPPTLCLITEIMERGSLTKILFTPGELSWDMRVNFARDIASGMEYLHKNNILHRDIKSSNLLVGADWSVRIADFGFSRIKAVNQTMTQCGTVAWTAPEIFDDSHYTEKADVYSFGIVLWELIFRLKPWTNKHSMKTIQAVVNGERPSIANMPAETPAVLKSLMIKCWAQEPQARPTFEEVCEQLKY